MEVKWGKKGFSDLTWLYDFLAPVSQSVAASAVQSLTAAPTKLLASHARCAASSLVNTKSATRLRDPLSTCCAYGIQKSIDRLSTPCSNTPEHHLSRGEQRQSTARVAASHQPVDYLLGLPGQWPVTVSEARIVSLEKRLGMIDQNPPEGALVELALPVEGGQTAGRHPLCLSGFGRPMVN